MNRSSAAGLDERAFGNLEIGRNRVIEYFAIELNAQDDHVLAVPRQKPLIGIS